MIGFLRGECLSFTDRAAILLTAGGVGYEVYLTTTHLSSLSPGGQCELYIHTIVREDALELYGFENNVYKKMFSILISVSRLGPRIALAILSLYSPDKLAAIVMEGNVEAIIRVPGIGRKSAERIVSELKYKLKAMPAETASSASVSHNLFTDVTAGLMNLGYDENLARETVFNVFEAEPDLDETAAIRAALKLLSGTKK